MGIAASSNSENNGINAGDQGIPSRIITPRSTKGGEDIQSQLSSSIPASTQQQQQQQGSSSNGNGGQVLDSLANIESDGDNSVPTVFKWDHGGRNVNMPNITFSSILSLSHFGFYFRFLNLCFHVIYVIYVFHLLLFQGVHHRYFQQLGKANTHASIRQ